MPGHFHHLTRLTDLAGKAATDIGAGDGAFVMKLADAGAKATGIEIDASKVAIARRAVDTRATILEGRAEALPLAEQSQDLLCFLFSMHHVPLDVQDKAMAEIRRVLKPGGRLHVVDPRPFGPMTEVCNHIDDETVVRTGTQARLDRLGEADGLKLIEQWDYMYTRTYPTFDDLVATIIAVDPERTARFAQVESEMREDFERIAGRSAKGYVLDQPCAAYHFERV